MDNESQNIRSHDRWAHFRFSVVGALLAAPPPRGGLQAELKELAAKKWRHPISGEWTVFGCSTIERWYYQALRSNSKCGPLDVLKRKIRCDAGEHPAVSSKLAELLAAQYRGILDDRSRLCCHLQWYLAEGASELCHGLSQAIEKRGLPRSMLFDYMSRHIIDVLCPTALCGRDPQSR